MTATIRPPVRRAKMHAMPTLYWLAVIIALALGEFDAAKIALAVLVLIGYVWYRETLR